jgi:hypothetical protein
MSNKIISNKYVLLTATILSAMMLAGSAVSSLLPTTTAFAASDDGDIVVDPTSQTDVETGLNIEVDPDVLISNDCEDLNDASETEQENDLPVNQEDQNNNDVGDGGIVVEPTVQTAVQTGLNINVDPDVFVVIGCGDVSVEVNDDDETEQENDLPAEQEALSDSEVGEDGVLVSPDIQTAAQTEYNINEDSDAFVVPS